MSRAAHPAEAHAAPGEVAVVLTSFEGGRRLRDAAESVRAQSRPPAEWVVVDAGSTDLATIEELRRLETEAVRVIRTPGESRAGARNRGIAATRAPYVAVLEADDGIAPRYLEETATRLDRDPTLDYVSTAVEAFGEASYTWTPPGGTVLDYLGCGTVHASTLFRRGLWEAIGGYDTAFPVCLDVDFWVSALELGARGVVLDEPLFHYRVRRDSLYRRALAEGRCAPEMQAVLRKHRQTVEALGIDLLVAREAFIGEQRAHRDALRGRTREAERSVSEADETITAAQAALARGRAGGLDWGALRRLTPLSATWGLDRGGPLDRYYIERFLGGHAADVWGRVLEVKDPGYALRFGGARVTQVDVLDVDPANARATVVADLSRADALPADTYDCFILTQTLHVIYDVRSALRHAVRILKPGGVLLLTAPAVSRVSYEDGGLDGGDYWRFTASSLRELLGEVLPGGEFEIMTYGNVLACVAFLYGLAPHELEPAELEHVDPYFPLLYGVRAAKRYGRP